MAQLLTATEPLLLAQGIQLCRTRRPYDDALWPLATHGFFRFRESALKTALFIPKPHQTTP
jgi:deoxyribodipyrimidine photo-lyase